MSALSKRIMALERSYVTTGKPPALIVIHGSAWDHDAIVAVDGIDMRRRARETADQFLDRLEDHLRKTRPANLPYVGFPQYAGDEPEDQSNGP